MMERKRFNRQRVTLLVIGAGASALALIAFSGTCWFATCWLDDTFVGDLTFWDILGVSAGGFAMILIVRPFRSARRNRTDSNVPTDSVRTSSTPLSTWTTTHSARPHRATERSLAPRSLAPAATIEAVPASHAANTATDRTSSPITTGHGNCTSATARWREMYEQLSDEERRMFKAVMKQYCAGDGPESRTNP